MTSELMTKAEFDEKNDDNKPCPSPREMSNRTGFSEGVYHRNVAISEARRGIALKRAVETLTTAVSWTTEDILTTAEAFEKYLKAGKNG